MYNRSCHMYSDALKVPSRRKPLMSRPLSGQHRLLYWRRRFRKVTDDRISLEGRTHLMSVDAPVAIPIVAKVGAKR
jgi:hypothetical protein